MDVRKLIDPLLVLILIVTIGYLILAGDRENGTVVSAASASETPVRLVSVTTIPTRTSTPTDVPTATLIPASVTVPTKTVTPHPTSLPTSTATITPTASLTPTKAPTQSAVEQEINDGIARGNQIVQAIESYHNSQGQYPSTLDALIPAYLSGIPLTETDRPFFYRLFDGSSPMASEVYWLAFRLDSRDHVTCTYLRRLDYWDCNFASP